MCFQLQLLARNNLVIFDPVINLYEGKDRYQNHKNTMVH